MKSFWGCLLPLQYFGRYRKKRSFSALHRVVLGAAASILQFREDKLKKKVKITYRERMVDGGAERCKGPGSPG